jgi:hypothetical protein
MEYNICISLPVIGNDWLLGWRGGGMRPCYVGAINSAIQNDGNLDNLVEQEETRMAESGSETAVSYISMIAKELRRHPMITGFFLGKEYGVTVDCPSNAISYQDLATDDRGIAYAKEHGRLISDEDMDIAVVSGALFGGTHTQHIRDVENDLKGRMYTAKPKSFEQTCDDMFRANRHAARKDVANSVDDDRLNIRRENFANALFNAIIGDNVHDMSNPYLR